ncbi:MAG: DUF115 domain-containing protein [Candidatus Heimdallarchaeota archaeon]|nr:MAG: DUF115 domain-containing protein [Candidatus Heimdallarchaeota archaeon]
MNWQDWKNEYFQIMQQLGFNTEADKRSAQLLKEFLIELMPIKKEKILQKLKAILQEPVIIAGAGPSLEEDVSTLFSTEIMSNLRSIAVDGATTFLRNENIVPSIVVTDLDGDWKSIRWAINNGALTLIHAHGDNKQQISRFITQNSEIISNNYVWGTTQCEPGQVLLNFGGFTDGDRAIFLAFHFQSPLIGLIGFDFGYIIGRYSTLDSPIKKSKRKKLEKFKIARKLLASYHSQHKGLRFNLTCQGQSISGFPKVKLTCFIKKWSQWNK